MRKKGQTERRVRPAMAIIAALCCMIIGTASIARPAVNTPAGGIAILQPEDEVPRDAQRVDERYFTGSTNDGACAYYELLLEASRYATANGANVMQVVSRKAHSRTQRCDGIEVAFYNAANPYLPEQSFRWDTTHPLTWEDFRGGIRRGAGDHIAAETSCGIAIETNLAGAGDAVKVYVFNTFDKQQSWVREGFRLPDVLQHEQGHWDICELYTRRMQARFDAAHITGVSIHDDVSRIYDEVSAEYLARQELYEQETQHGTIEREQQRWSRMIADELAVSSLSKL